MTVKQRTGATRHSFVMVPNDVARDFEMSSNAFRILTYIMSFSEDWSTSKRRLADQTNMGRAAVRTAVDQLVELGYCDVEQSDPDDPSTITYSFGWTRQPPPGKKPDHPRARNPTTPRSRNRTTTKEHSNERSKSSSEDGRASAGNSATTPPIETVPDPLGVDDQRLDPMQFVSEYGRNPKHRRIQTDPDKIEQAGWLCEHFPADVLREILSVTEHLPASLRWEYVTLCCECYARDETGESVMQPTRFMRQWREAVDQNWPWAQTERLRRVVLNHHAVDIARALAATHDANFPGWKYFKPTLKSFTEEREGAA